MSKFDEREKGFERMFTLDQEIQFKVTNRRNRMLGMWVASQIGKTGADADAYAKEVVMSDFEKAGDEDVVSKVVKDLTAAGRPTDAVTVRSKMEVLLREARTQIMEEHKK